MKTGKVYVGKVLIVPDPGDEPGTIVLMPMLSGYRDAHGQLTLTTDYEAIYSTLRAGRALQLGLPPGWHSQFEVLIRTDEIITAARFSRTIYDEFNPGWDRRNAQQILTSAV